MPHRNALALTWDGGYLDVVRSLKPVAERSREDLTVQVQIAGEWHRRAIGGRYTGCGRYDLAKMYRDHHYSDNRHESYEGKLCQGSDGHPSCFTPFEHVESEKANAEAEARSRAAEAADKARWDARFEEMKQVRAAREKADRERRAAGIAKLKAIDPNKPAK